MSIRALAYKLPAVRKALAVILDRLKPLVTLVTASHVDLHESYLHYLNESYRQRGREMTHWDSTDSIESTRIAFLKLEHCCFDCDEAAVTYLRHRLLNHLGDLEAQLASIQNQALFEADCTAHHPSIADLETLEEDSANFLPHKLD